MTPVSTLHLSTESSHSRRVTVLFAFRFEAGHALLQGRQAPAVTTLESFDSAAEGGCRQLGPVVQVGELGLEGLIHDVNMAAISAIQSSAESITSAPRDASHPPATMS